MRKKDLQRFHIIEANENIRSKVRSNFVILNIPVKRKTNGMAGYGIITHVMSRRGFARTFKLIILVYKFICKIWRILFFKQ